MHGARSWARPAQDYCRCACAAAAMSSPCGWPGVLCRDAEGATPALEAGGFVWLGVNAERAGLFAGCGITSFPAAPGLEAVTAVDLRGNRLGSVGALPSLRTLVLADPKGAGALGLPAGLAGLRDLTSLDLSGAGAQC